MTLRAWVLALTLGSALAVPVGAAEISGRVLSEGQPVAGATVDLLPYETPFEQALREARAQDAPAVLATVASRKDGTFVLPMPAPRAGTDSALRLKVSGPGLPPVLLADVFDAAEDRDVGDVAPERGAPLSGKVLGTTGAPLAGAEVTLWPGASSTYSLDGPLELLPLRATTSASGTFTLEHAADYGNRLRIEARGYALLEVTGAGKGPLRSPVALRPARRIEGTVLRTDARTPAAGVVVRFLGRVTSRWVETAANGSFHIEDLPEGEGSIVARGGDLGGASVVAPQKGRATVTLLPWSAISGRVVDVRTANPLPRIRVVARSEGDVVLTRSGPDGRYALGGLPARSHRLSVDDLRYVPWSADSLRVGTAATATRDIALAPCAVLRGRVVDESGVPIADARGVVLPLAPKSFKELFRPVPLGGPNTFRSRPDGTFLATRLSPGDGQTLTVSRETYAARKVGLSLLPGSGNPPLTIVLQRGLSLSGIVKGPDDQLLAGVDMSLFRTQSTHSRRGQFSFVFDGMSEQVPPQTTASDGRFLFKGLLPGQYSLSAKKAGHGQKRVEPVVVAEGGAPEPLEIVLAAGATISGFVRDTQGRGVEGLRLMVRPSAGGGQGGMTFFEQGTGPDGAFALEDVAAGERYDVQVVTPTGSGPVKAGVLAPAEGVEITTAALGGLAGSVTEADGERPVTEYSVTYRPTGMMGGVSFGFRGRDGQPGGAGVPVAVHAADGKFRLAEVPPGSWSIEVRAEGYLDGHLAPVVVEENRATEGVDVRLARGASLRGRALDADSARPIMDVQVRARLQGDPRGAYSFPFDEGGLRATSDASGTFEIKGLAPGTYAVTGTHADHADATQTVVVKEQEASLDLRLARGTVLAGVVVSGGRPVAGAAVDLAVAGEETGFGAFSGHSVLTGEGGRFRFDHLLPGRFTLSASQGGESSPPLEVALQGGQGREDLLLALSAGAVIHGRVVGLAEEALAGLQVSASGPDGFEANTRTSAGGAFEVLGVPQGAISLRVYAGDFMGSMRNAGTQVVVAEGQTEVNAEVRFEAGFRLSGHVTQGGQPLPGMMVMAYPEGPGRPGGNTRAGDDGAYALEGLVEGAYHVHANSAVGGTTNIEKKITLTGDTTLDLDVPLSRLAGTVVDAESHKALADAIVWLEGESGKAATTDGTGRFAIDSLEARAYHLSARKPGYQTGSSDPTASEDSDLVVELRKGDGVAVIARDGLYGTPLRNVAVHLLDAQGATVFADDLALDGEGRGEIPSVAPGTYELRASAVDYAPVTLPRVAVPTAPVALAFTPGGHVEIHCGPETLARSDASARLLTATGAVYKQAFYSADGLIPLSLPVRRIEHVVPGHYTLSVTGGPSPGLDVREGETASVTLP